MNGNRDYVLRSSCQSARVNDGRLFRSSYKTLLKVLRDMSEPFHAHGFRSGFTGWIANKGFLDAVVEATLVHKTPDALQAACHRTTYLGTSENPGARV